MKLSQPKNLDIYIYESLKLKKAEQNQVANRFFRCTGKGYGLSKAYDCLLCHEEISAPSPRLAAWYHRHRHPEIVDAFRQVGLYDVWSLK